MLSFIFKELGLYGTLMKMLLYFNIFLFIALQFGMLKFGVVPKHILNAYIMPVHILFQFDYDRRILH